MLPSAAGVFATLCRSSYYNLDYVVPLAHAQQHFPGFIYTILDVFALCRSYYYNLEDCAIKRRADGAPWTWWARALSNSLQHSC